MMAPIYQDKNMWGADGLQKQTPQRMNLYCKKKNSFDVRNINKQVGNHKTLYWMRYVQFQKEEKIIISGNLLIKWWYDILLS